ncbi:MAG: ATP synthase F0 subunit B [Candidatus Acidiferrales bacterium]
MDLVHQLGELFLAALPTVVLVFLFYFFLRWSFFKPIERVLAERRTRTEGARRAADAIRQEAQEKLQTYRVALKNAGAQLFTEQETARRHAIEKHEAAVRSARAAAQERVRAAKLEQEREFAAARTALEAPSIALGREIARSFLAPDAPRSPGLDIAGQQ